jgi:hypothetical protein
LLDLPFFVPPNARVSKKDRNALNKVNEQLAKKSMSRALERAKMNQNEGSFEMCEGVCRTQTPPVVGEVLVDLNTPTGVAEACILDDLSVHFNPRSTGLAAARKILDPSEQHPACDLHRFEFKFNPPRNESYHEQEFLGTNEMGHNSYWAPLSTEACCGQLISSARENTDATPFLNTCDGSNDDKTTPSNVSYLNSSRFSEVPNTPSEELSPRSSSPSRSFLDENWNSETQPPRCIYSLGGKYIQQKKLRFIPTLFDVDDPVDGDDTDDHDDDCDDDHDDNNDKYTSEYQSIHLNETSPLSDVCVISLETTTALYRPSPHGDAKKATQRKRRRWA